MTRLEKIELLKRYKEFLICLYEYKQGELINEEKNELKEPQKILVLRKHFYGKNLKVA